MLAGVERLVPTADWSGQHVCFAGTPGATPVQVHGRWIVEDRLHDPPLLLQRVGPAEAPGVACEGVLEQPLIGLLTLSQHLAEVDLEVDWPAAQLVSRHLRLQVQHDAIVLAEPEAQMVRVRGTGSRWREQQPRWRVELDDRLRRR